ncbi:Na+/H+ antiporter NhaC family protein [Bacillus massiliigorillae]|uniref:Na+/H+ antiporter NhaC family protein n=1 Tax=Bacillus massiliigorillae TaxID=1243664 RepID=UPI00039DE1AF|nr:Na+/H+ antiporter NhaC family protein [Bacillus massiliigorillae]
MEYSFLSIIPPIIIIALVIFTRKIVLSLGIGIGIAAIIIEQGNIFQAIKTILQAIFNLFYSDGEWSSGNLYVLSFLLLLGALTGLISALGGNRAFGNWIGRRIRTKRGAQLMTTTCGVSLFPDDVFSMFVTSQITGPVIDYAKVPRTKLAYLIHSTSDPTCVICPLSSWGAYIIGILTSIFAALQITDNPLIAFLIIATTNFYALSTLIFVFSSAAFDINIGKMKKQVAINQQQIIPTSTMKGTVWDLIIPIGTLIIGAITTMIITGYIHSDTPTIMAIFSNSQVSLSLVIGAGLATFISFLLYTRQVIAKKQHFKQVGSILKRGMKTTIPAVEILLYAWVLSNFIDQLETGAYLASLIENITLPPSFLPLIFFLLTGAMAFATGTSWGTFAIMLPIAAQIAEATDPSLMFFLMSAVLSGSLFGDHTSPVSDTTTVASAAAGCSQIDHVVTQLPYALICASITAISFLLLGISGMRWIPYVFIILTIGLLIYYFKRKTDCSKSDF